MFSVCVFLASGRGADPIFTEAARACGAGIAARGWRLVYGGAHRGLMGELADAALAAGGEVLGVLPRDLAAREIAHHGLTRLELVDSMAERKDRMFRASDGFLTLPGGYGTLVMTKRGQPDAVHLFSRNVADRLSRELAGIALWVIE